MATQDDTKPHDPLALLVERYEALALVSGEFLGHGSPVLTLLDGINVEFRALVDHLAERGTIS